MATAINMPQVGQDLETARILEWHVKEGDLVEVGDILATVESDKASFEVEAFEEGTILKILFREGEDGAVFKPIAYIGEPGEKIPGEDSDIQENESDLNIKKNIPGLTELSFKEEESKEHKKIFISPAALKKANSNQIDLNLIEATGPGKRIIKRDIINYLKSNERQKVTPVAREIAKAEGIELNSLSGSGHNGRINKTDVLNIIRKSNTIPVSILEKDEVIPFDRMRKVIAERLSISKQTIPHYYLHIDIDVEKPLLAKEKLLRELGIKVSFNDILIRVVSTVLQKFRWLNAHVDQEKVVLKHHINIGVAVSTDNGLLVPVVQEANKKNLTEISSEIRKLAKDANNGKINPSIQGSFTVSNLGMFGISGFQAIINPPECAILSVGAIEKKVIPNSNGLKITDIVNLGLAVDHRAVDGAYAARFLNELKLELTNFSI